MEKKNYVKLASGLLVLCLMTTCAISATFAKYATGGSANDSARVAKWGVRITMQGDSMFANEYESDTADYATVTVKSSDDQLVVAPGTKSTGSAVFSISGTPEVAVKIAIDFSEVKDVYLKAGTYSDETTTIADDTFTLAEDYYPVVFTLTQTHDANGEIADGGNVLKTGTLTEVKEYIDNWNQTATYQPNTDLASTFSLSWAWAIDGNDQADTLLGNLAVDESGVDVTNYNLSLSYNLTITATQID